MNRVNKNLKKLDTINHTHKAEHIRKILRFAGMKNIGDFDLVSYCDKNLKIIMKLFFEEINNLKDIEKLQKFKDYLNIEWKTVFDIDILLNKIDELIHNIIINEQTLFNEKNRKL